MFGIDSAELLIIAVVALVILGPKDLPRAMRSVGNFVARARGMASHFRTGVDAMMREAELEELNRQWKAQNERIMREHPDVEPVDAGSSAPSDWGAGPHSGPLGAAALPPQGGEAPPLIESVASPPPPPVRGAKPGAVLPGRRPPPPPPRRRGLP